MATREPPLTLGIEEEYLLVDRETRRRRERAAGRAVRGPARAHGGTGVPGVPARAGRGRDARLPFDRRGARRARRRCAAPSSRRPRSTASRRSPPRAIRSRSSSKQKRTDKERYVALLEEMQGAARRMMICGLHVHVGIEDDDLRIDLMNQLTYFLPHLLALSCSSPFWEGERTGLMSFRLMIFNGVPRTGLPRAVLELGRVPPPHRHPGRDRHHRRHVAHLVGPAPERALPDARDAGHGLLHDARGRAALAALNQCLLRMLYRLRRANQRWRMYSHLLLGENRWRAMRYSYDAGLLDLGQQRDRAVRGAARGADRAGARGRRGARLRDRDRGAARDPAARHQRAPPAAGVRRGAAGAGATESEALARGRRLAGRGDRAHMKAGDIHLFQERDSPAGDSPLRRKVNVPDFPGAFPSRR